jgi:hypothetical protein
MFARLIRTKTFWASLATILGAVGGAASGQMAILDAVQLAAPAVLAMCLRDGIATEGAAR